MSTIALTVSENEIIGLSDGVVYSSFEGTKIDGYEFKKVYKLAKNCLILFCGCIAYPMKTILEPIQEANTDYLDMENFSKQLDEIIRHLYEKEKEADTFLASHGAFVVGYNNAKEVMMYEMSKNTRLKDIPESQIYKLNVGATFCICDDLHTPEAGFKALLFDGMIPKYNDMKESALKAFEKTIEINTRLNKRIGGKLYLESLSKESF